MNNIILEIKEIRSHLREFSYNLRFINLTNTIIGFKREIKNINLVSRFPRIQRRSMILQ